uniref:Uncharacterized protein n=1 Tax=Anguilla anguilla TaxID=7936 RepID=A0A0E9XHM7_ANGAN
MHKALQFFLSLKTKKTPQLSHRTVSTPHLVSAGRSWLIFLGCRFLTSTVLGSAFFQLIKHCQRDGHQHRPQKQDLQQSQSHVV